LPIFVRINPSNGLYYERRKHSTTIKIDGEVLQESWRDQFLPRIEAMFRSNLLDDPEKRNTIALINPDIIVIQPQRVHVIENKPYYESKFDGNQGPGGAYIAFVKWLNNNKIPCEYLLIHSSSWKEYEQVKKI
jgi:hypothetical protein